MSGLPPVTAPMANSRGSEEAIWRRSHAAAGERLGLEDRPGERALDARLFLRPP